MLALVLDRVLPWYKAIDDCDAFREFCFDTHRWFMRRWNLSESFNALLVPIFELNPYHRIAASSIPHEVKKINYFIATPEETRFALQRYSDAAADRRRKRELAFLEGRCQIKPTAIFRAASPSPETSQSNIPGSNALLHVSSSSVTKRRDSPRTFPRGILRPNPEPLAPDTLGLTGMTIRRTADTADQVVSLSKALPADEDERWMQEVLIAAHRLEGVAEDVVTTVFPPQQRLRQSSFVRRPSPLRSSLTLRGGNYEVAGTSGTGDHKVLAFSSSGGVKIDDAPPLIADDDEDDDDASSDGLNSSGMPSTPRNRLASIPELQGAAGVADSSSSPETRRASLPRLLPMTVLSGPGVETFNPSNVKPSAFLSKARTIQPHKVSELTTQSHPFAMGDARLRSAVPG